MSISDEIVARVHEGRLIALVPSALGEVQRRMMFVTPELDRILIGPWGTSEEAKRFSLLKADLDHFVQGEFIGPKYLRQLIPKQDEIWEIKSPNPNPSLRVFGRFALYDIFVATHYELRSTLKGRSSEEWKREMRRCKAKWRQLFPSYTPHKGTKINDYVSNAARPELFR